MGVRGVRPTKRYRTVRPLGGGGALHGFKNKSAGITTPERVGRVINGLSRDRRTVAVSTFSALLVLLLAPTLLPVWGLQSIANAIFSHAATLKLDTDVLAGLALAGNFLSEARAELDEERNSIATERDAFVAFAEEVQSIPTASQDTYGEMTAHVSNVAHGGRQLEQVRETYRRTVMSLPDFEREYSEDFPEHIAAEFGADVAQVVVNGHQFSEPVKQMVVEGARQSAKQRQDLLDSIRAEERSLRYASSQLTMPRECLLSLDASELRQATVEELVESDSAICDSRNRCESVLATRQEDIHAMNNRAGGREAFLQEYLYRESDTHFPVLRTALEFIERLDLQRTVLVRALSHRA
jgi:hypothetical protein